MSPKPNEDDTASETLMQTQSYYNAADGLAANEATSEPSFYERMQEVEIAKVWAPICNKYKWLILGVWFVFWPLGAVCMPKFIDNTDSTFEAPSGSPADIAEDTYHEQYNITEDTQPEILILMERTDFSEGEDVNLVDPGSEIFNVSRAFTDDLVVYVQTLIDEINEDEKTDEYFASVGSYYNDLYALIPHYGALTYATEDKQTLYVGIANGMPDGNREDFNEDIRDWCEDNAPDQIKVQATGTTLFTIDTRSGTVSDMEMMDTIVLPLSLATLGYIVGNVALILVPIITIITSILVSGTFMYPVAVAMQVTQFTPSIMMSLTIAMSIDYSLFLLTRLTENLAFGADLEPAVENMLEHAGHTIIASGSTLICCFLGFLFFPLDLLKTVGIGASVAIASCLVVNLSLLPALMFVTGDRFLKPSERMAKLCCNEPGNPGRYRMRSTPVPEEAAAVVESETAAENAKATISEAATEPALSETQDLAEPLLANTKNELVKKEEEDLLRAVEADTEEDIEDMRQSVWYRSGSYLLSPKGPYVLLGLLMVMAPFCYYWVETGNSLSFDLFLPKSCDSRDAYDDFGEDFGLGTLSTYKLIFDGSAENIQVESETCFEVMDIVIQSLSDPDAFPASPSLMNFNGIYSLNGTQISYEEYMDAAACGTYTSCDNEEQRTIATVGQRQNSPYNTSTYSSVVLDVDAYSADGTEWLSDARELIDDLEKEGKLQGYSVVLQAGASVMYDAVDDVYDSFPLMIGITLVVVFLLVAFFFNSFMAPLRSVFTIGVTLMFCYGLSVLVYQYAWLDWLSWDSVEDSGEIAWMPPLMAFSIIVGLGLDYDIFLASRVLEFRMMGYDENSAVLKGLYKTGGIITAAGTIMAIAFGGLIFASELLLNQFGFYIFVAVIMDTFVVRTIMVPILMGLSGKYTWWPAKLPAETRSWDTPDSLVQ